MKFSKKVMIIKRLVEEALYRDKNTYEPILDRDPEQTRQCLAVMASLIPQHRLYIIADSTRFAHDFANAIGKPYLHIMNPDQLRGLNDCSVIILRTGSRTPQQRQNFEAIQAHLCKMSSIIVWSISEWR